MKNYVSILLALVLVMPLWANETRAEGHYEDENSLERRHGRTETERKLCDAVGSGLLNCKIMICYESESASSSYCYIVELEWDD